VTAPESTPLRALIVDDEPPARRKVRLFLERDPEIEIVGEANSGERAVEAMRKLGPDVVFLDIQLGEMDGFDVLQSFDIGELPQIVFVTAFDEYALKAFEVAAVDYLLKPFDAERFAAAVDRVKQKLRAGSTEALEAQVRKLLSTVGRGSHGTRRLLVKSRDRGQLVEVADIAWIHAAGNYVELHVGGKEYLLRETLEGMGRQLDGETFLRVHRSFIVNARFIDEIQPESHGDHLILMKDGAKIRLSRRYRDRLPDGIRRHL